MVQLPSGVIQIVVQDTNNETYRGYILLTNGSLTSTMRPYDHTGASYYVIAVVMVYGLSIVMLIASHIKRRHDKYVEDRQINRYLRDAPTLKEKSAKDRWKELKMSFIPVTLATISMGAQHRPSFTNYSRQSVVSASRVDTIQEEDECENKGARDEKKSLLQIEEGESDDDKLDMNVHQRVVVIDEGTEDTASLQCPGSVQEKTSTDTLLSEQDLLDTAESDNNQSVTHNDHINFPASLSKVHSGLRTHKENAVFPQPIYNRLNRSRPSSPAGKNYISVADTTNSPLNKGVAFDNAWVPRTQEIEPPSPAKTSQQSGEVEISRETQL